MARASYRIFDSQNDTYSQLQRHSDVPTDTKNFMPKKDGTLVVEEDVAKFVVVVQQPEITSPENGTEDFMGMIVLTPYTPGESYAGKQTALRYQLALDEDFERLVGDNTIVTTSNKFKPIYGHNDELNTENNHEETEHDGVHIIEDFDRSQAKIYVRAKYISDVNSSLWSDYIYYITPDAYPVEPELVLEWESNDNVPQIVTVEANFKGLSSDGETPSITLNSTDWILKKEDGTVVFESLNDTTNKTSFTFKDKFETNTTYTLEVKFHTEAGDTDASTITFTTASTWIELPDGIDFDNIIGDLREGYLGKSEFSGSSKGNSYNYIGEKSRKIGIRSGSLTADYTQGLTTNRDFYYGDVVSYNNVLYTLKPNLDENTDWPCNPDYDITTSDKFNRYTTDIVVPNYRSILDQLAAIGLYNNSAFSKDNIKYLSDFDFGGVSGKFTKFEESLGFQYDETGVKEVTGYFVPTKKGDDEQAWNKGNEWYTIVNNGKVKYVSTVHFKYISPFELGLCHLTGKGRTIRIGYHLWRVSIMTLQDAYEFNKIFNGKLANENPGYDDADENNITLEIVRSNEDTLTKYNYVRLGKNIDVMSFDPLSARLLDDKVSGKKYYPSYRLVLEYVPESEEPWKSEHLSKINTGPKAVIPNGSIESNLQASNQHINVNTNIDGETLIYDKFSDTGFFGIVSGADLFTTDEINNALTVDGEKADFEQEWCKFYYHGKIIYIPKLMVRMNVSWKDVMDNGWYVSTPYSSIINKTILSKNGKYFVGGLQGMSSYFLSPSGSSYSNTSRSMYNETLLRLMPGFSGGVNLSPFGEYFGSAVGYSTNIQSSLRGTIYSGNIQIGLNFVDSREIYTEETLSKLPTYTTTSSKTMGVSMSMCASIEPQQNTWSNETYGISVDKPFLSVNNIDPGYLTTGGYYMFNYTQYVTSEAGQRPIGSVSNPQYRKIGGDTPATYLFSPFLEQISESQKNDIDDFNRKVEINVTKYEAHLTKIEEQRAIQEALERAEAEYLGKIEKEGIDERFEGNIRTPMAIEPNALTAPTNGEPVSVDTLTGSKYIVGKSFRGEHTGSDVEWALDEAFNNKVASMSIDGNSTRVTVNKSLITNEDHFDTPVYARIRYKSNNVTSEWSDAVTGQISAVPPLPDISLPFKKDRPGTPKTVSSAAYFIRSFTYYGHVEEDRLSPYGVNRGTIDPDTSPFPILLQLGDRFVYKPNGKTYRVVWEGGSTVADADKSTVNAYINHTTKANFIIDITTPYGDIQFQPVEDGDVKFGYTAAWWGWYIGNLNVIINPTDQEKNRPELKDQYMVITQNQPTKNNIDVEYYQYSNYNTAMYGMPLPQVYKLLTPWFFPGGYKTMPATKNTTTNLKNQVNSLSAFVNVNEFVYFDNDDNMKLIYAPNIPIGDNVNFWYVACNYNAYEGQHTVRLGDYLFYKRLPYVDEVKCMSDAGALANFSGSILTLDGPADNYANSGMVADKDIVATVIENGKFVGTENKTRNDGLLYMPVLEFIPEEEESKLFDSKLGRCNYDKEINIGFYSSDNTEIPNTVTLDSPKRYATRTRRTLRNIYFHYQGIDTWFRNCSDSFTVSNPDNVNTINAAFMIQSLLENSLTGYAIPSYTINGITNIVYNPRILVSEQPWTVTYKNIKWAVCTARWEKWPIIDRKRFNGLSSSSYNGYEVYYRAAMANMNYTYSILTMYDTELTIIGRLYSTISNPYNWPYYSKDARKALLSAESYVYYKNTFPYFYSYVYTHTNSTYGSFNPISNYDSYYSHYACMQIYRALK